MPRGDTAMVVRVQDMAVVKRAEELAAARPVRGHAHRGITGDTAATRHRGSQLWGCLRGDMAAARLIGTGLQRSLWGHSHGKMCVRDTAMAMPTGTQPR